MMVERKPGGAFMSRSRSIFAYQLGPFKTPVVDAGWLQELADIAILEYQACARKVALAANIWDYCIHQNVLVGDHVTDAGHYAASETAKVLGCSKAVADTLAEIGMDLRLRLPAVRAAFDAGEFDLARVRAIYRTTSSYTLGAVEAAQSEILHAARRLSPGPLATEIADIMHRIAPQEAAALRKDITTVLTRVRYRDKDILSTIEADLEAGDAAACWQLINEMAATLCPRDPRTRGQRLAAAYIALLRRDDYLACTCEVDEDHPCTARRDLPDHRRPLTHITIDLNTLVGLADLPAHLAGHGLIDADYARQLSENATWQLIVTEAADLAEQIGINGAAGEENSVGDSPKRASHQIFHPLGRGRRRAGLNLPKSPAAGPIPPGIQATGEYRGANTLITALEAAIAANPALGTALYPDGHGGYAEPPGGALTYRPSSALADCVRHRDRTCRHPGCDVPSANCEIDHVVPFRQYDPGHGGWTILTNLHCLCRYHHMLKTMGVWIPTMLAGGVDYWVSSSGTTAVTLPGNLAGRTDHSEESPVPHVPRKRRTTCGTGSPRPAMATGQQARHPVEEDPPF